jgi:hypothetical protein
VPSTLTWADLLIEDVDHERASSWLDDWSWLVTGPFTPVCLSRFGDWFLRRPDGRLEMLDVLAGTLSTVARSTREFEDRVNDPGWRDEYLFASLIRELHARDKVPGPDECYAIVPHPEFGGRYEPDCVLIVDLGLWQTICAHSFRTAEGQSKAKWWQAWL